MKPILAILILSLLSLAAAAQPPAIQTTPYAPEAAGSPPYALTDAEQRQWAAFAEAEKQLNQALNAAVNSARGMNNDTTTAVQFLGNVQRILDQIDLNTARREAFLATMQARESCKGCQIDGGKLMPQKEGKP